MGGVIVCVGGVETNVKFFPKAEILSMIEGWITAKEGCTGCDKRFDRLISMKSHNVRICGDVS